MSSWAISLEPYIARCVSFHFFHHCFETTQFKRNNNKFCASPTLVSKQKKQQIQQQRHTNDSTQKIIAMEFKFIFSEAFIS